MINRARTIFSILASGVVAIVILFQIRDLSEFSSNLLVQHTDVAWVIQFASDHWLLIALIFVALFIAASTAFDRLIRWCGRVTNSRVEAQQTWSSVASDAPIETPEGDQLQRVDFSRQIAEDLILPPGSASAVYALEAPWGSGKTSVLHFVEQHIRNQNPHCIIFRFNLWEYSSITSLSTGFLLGLANNLCDQAIDQRLGIELKKSLTGPHGLSSLFDSIQGDAFLLGILRWCFQSFTQQKRSLPDADKVKDAINSVLSRLNQPVVVIIDDVDRCDPEVIRAIFHLIKSLCNYRRFAYILAFDRQPIIEALSHDSCYDGSAFLEKMVQVVYKLPRLGFVARRNALVTRWQQIEARQELGLSDKERRRVFDDAIPAIARATKTLRDIVRVANCALPLLGSTKGEVSSADVLLHALLQTRYPKVWQLIFDQPERFALVADIATDEVSTRSLIIQQMNDKSGTDNKEDLIRDIEEVSGSSVEIVKDLLTELFPTLLTEFELLPPPGEGRTCYLNALRILLSRQVAPDTYSVMDARDFLTSDKNRHDIFQGMVRQGEIDNWLEFVRNLIAVDQPEDTKQFISFVVDAAHSVWQLRHIDIVDSSAQVILKVVSCIRSPNLRFELLRYLAKDPTFVSLSENVVLHLLRDSGLWTSGTYHKEREEQDDVSGDSMPIKELVELKQLWVKAACRAAAGDDFIYSEPHLISVLFRMGQLANNGYRVVWPLTDRIIKNKPMLIHFISSFRNSNDLESAKPMFSDWPAFLDLALRQRLDDSARKVLENIRLESSREAPSVV